MNITNLDYLSYLNNNTILECTMRVHQENLGLAVVEIQFHDLLVNLLLTMNFLRKPLLQTTMNK